MMNTRVKLTVCLLGLGLILAILPYNGGKSLSGKPGDLLRDITSEKTYLTPDEVARMIVSNDSSLRLIDVRTKEEYDESTLPGALNLPYGEFTRKDLSVYLGKGNACNVLFSNGDIDAGYALVLAKGLKFSNVFIMKGGMNEWYNTVMNSRFEGERITARENALFEIRTKAKRLFTEMNSLPDSLKAQLLAAKQLEATKLDGGCE